MSGGVWDQERIRRLIGSPEGRFEVRQRLENEMSELYVLLGLKDEKFRLFEDKKEE